jgi:hypothetical protein
MGDAKEVETTLSDADIVSMTVPTWEQAKAAIDRGDPAMAKALIDRAVSQWRSLQDYSINWVTSLLSFVGQELGEEAVERSLRVLGEDFVRPRRDTGVEWGSLPASARAKVIARAMVANFGRCEVSEDDEKVTLSFRCGTGGRLIDEGRYEGPNAYLTLSERAPRTFMRNELPVYCAHCSVNNEIQAIEWGGQPTSIEHPPTQKGEPCVHHIYKDAASIPDQAFERIGMSPTRRRPPRPDEGKP